MNSPFEQGVGYIEFSRLSITVNVQTQIQSFVPKMRINEQYLDHSIRGYSLSWYACEKLCSNLYLKCIEMKNI